MKIISNVSLVTLEDSDFIEDFTYIMNPESMQMSRLDNTTFSRKCACVSSSQDVMFSI